MKLTINDVKEIEKVQLTPQEITVLTLLLKLEPNQVAYLLDLSKQRISQIKTGAYKKLEAQGWVVDNHKRIDSDEEVAYN